MKELLRKLEEELGGSFLNDAEEIGIVVRKGPEHIAADAQVAGKEAEVDYLINSIRAFYKDIRDNTKRHKDEVKELKELLEQRVNELSDFSESYHYQKAGHINTLRSIRDILNSLNGKTSKKDILKTIKEVKELYLSSL